MRKYKIIVWGVGAMGQGIIKTLIHKEDVEIVGAIDMGDKLGVDIYQLIQHPCTQSLLIQSAEQVIGKIPADVVIMATDSFVLQTLDKILVCIDEGYNVLSTAEEMAYPQAQYPKIYEQIDEAAKKANVSVLGTGINPGFMMDTLAIVLSSVCTDINQIKITRTNSLSPFGISVMKEQGVGLTKEQFDLQVANHTISGHVGFIESCTMIADALALKLDKIDILIQPIVSLVERKTAYAHILPGQVAGSEMEAIGYVNGQPWIILCHPQQIEPQNENVKTQDKIEIIGTPNVSMSIEPEVDGGIGTIALIVNNIAPLVNAPAGCLTMLDMPLPRWWGKAVNQ